MKPLPGSAMLKLRSIVRDVSDSPSYASRSAGWHSRAARWGRGRRAVAVAAGMDFSKRLNARERRAENAPGPFFVDRTCIGELHPSLL